MDNTIIFGGMVVSIIIGLILGIIIGASMMVEPSNTNIITPRIDCPICRACPPEKICINNCPKCETCPKTQDIDCPEINECPKRETCPNCMTQTFITHNLKEIAEMRPKPESPAWQDGFYRMRNSVLKAFGYKNISKFKEARSGFDPDLFYFGGTTDKNIGQYTFNQFTQYGNTCFNVSQYPDENKRPRWSWNKEDCQKSTLTICHI